jgi:hypothetical protein
MAKIRNPESLDAACSRSRRAYLYDRYRSPAGTTLKSMVSMCIQLNADLLTQLSQITGSYYRRERTRLLEVYDDISAKLVINRKRCFSPGWRWNTDLLIGGAAFLARRYHDPGKEEP